MLKGCLLVGLGGAAGSMLRYMLGYLPVYTLFPVVTLAINIMAAVVMGFVTVWLEMRVGGTGELSLLLRTGFCGGFSTLSALSLEVVKLGQTHHMVMGVAYAMLSLLMCLVGIMLGEFLAAIAFRETGI